MRILQELRCPNELKLSYEVLQCLELNALNTVHGNNGLIILHNTHCHKRAIYRGRTRFLPPPKRLEYGLKPSFLLNQPGLCLDTEL